MSKSIKYLDRKFNEVFHQIAKESGIEEEILENDKKEIKEKIDNIQTMVSWYKTVIIVFTIIFVIFSGSNLYKHQKDIKTILATDTNNTTTK